MAIDIKQESANYSLLAKSSPLPVFISEIWELVMDREAWHAAIHGVAKSGTGLKD